MKCIESNDKLYLCQYGLLRLGWRKEEVIRWDAVSDMYGSSDRLIALKREGGKIFTIAESWACDKEFSRSITAILMEGLWPQTLERFNTASSFQCDLLYVNKKGLHYECILLRWEEIDDLQEKAGRLVVTVRGKKYSWQSVEGRNIYKASNLPLIVALGKHMLRARLVGVLVAKVAREWAEIAW